MSRYVGVPAHAHPVRQQDYRDRLLTAGATLEMLQQWVFKDYLFVGCFPDEAPLLAEHIHAAVRLAEQDEADLGMTGGRTRKKWVGDLTEAEAYADYAAAEVRPKFNCGRLRCEKWARDSTENVVMMVALALEEAEVQADPAKLQLIFVGWR